ncbi:phosphonate ABC transporter, permease protein PhnE [Tenuibacillus multivorans]|uniref:Phosphonate transport system permease protein n=1 Tax=Tenuibacillus multivorans TaxID=237069 RepID=A0A1G9ZYY2_9BACI|nr:phosphonate ABC transporter, permease protein PhnE [Tenuibacillus multivorans]GEL76906.1 phosphonate ABC transporter permease [Tenuibacillus multivorans]SDN26550.1 phosphonate transport system permease protein [Tenuibacillus multivorans]
MGKYLPPKPHQTQKRIRNLIIYTILAIIFIWAFKGVWDRADWSVFNNLAEKFQRVIPSLFSPDWNQLDKVWEKIVETVFIAYAGTLIAAILAVPFGFWAAKNMVKSPIWNTLGKWFLILDRTFPELILAIFFVITVGPGAFAGVLTIGLTAFGMLGKLYAEVIESIDMKVVEAMEANGANKMQILFYAIFPQVLPEFLSFALYRFEIDIRASTILGLVGAGGIGTLIVLSAANRNWEQLGLILLGIIVVVSVIDFASTKIRKRLV